MQQYPLAFVYVGEFYQCKVGYETEDYVVLLVNIWIKIPFLLSLSDVLEEA